MIIMFVSTTHSGRRTLPPRFLCDTRKIKIIFKNPFVTFHISIGDMFWAKKKFQAIWGSYRGVTEIFSRGGK